MTVEIYYMINLHERMLPTSAGVEPATSWSPVGRRIQLSHRGRNIYLSGYLHTHSVQNLLHGKVTVTDEDNKTMFSHVQEFIVKSKRFLWYKDTNVILMQIILKESTYGVKEPLSLSLSLSLSLCMFDVYARARISECMRLCTCPNASVYVCFWFNCYDQICQKAQPLLTVRSWKILYCCKLCCIWNNQNKV